MFEEVRNYFWTVFMEDPVDVTHVVLVRDAQFSRHPQHAVPEHRVNGEGLARGGGLGPPVIKQQILDIGAGASLKQSTGLLARRVRIRLFWWL